MYNEYLSKYMAAILLRSKYSKTFELQLTSRDSLNWMIWVDEQGTVCKLFNLLNRRLQLDLRERECLSTSKTMNDTLN